MSTHLTTSNPVRSDLGAADDSSSAADDSSSAAPARPSRRWALAGIGAGLAGIATTTTSGMIDAVYDPDLVDNPVAVVDRLSELTGTMLVFHTVTMVGAVLLVVFAAGLWRRLRATTGDASLAPLIAFSGLLGTAVVSVLGAGLDTEFIFGLMEHDDVLHPANAALYNHWIGTIPWIWVLAGLSGLAVYAAARSAGAPRWLGRVGLVLGGLTLLLGISPLQYMAGMTGPVWLLVSAVGFYSGDRLFRR